MQRERARAIEQQTEEMSTTMTTTTTTMTQHSISKRKNKKKIIIRTRPLLRARARGLLPFAVVHRGVICISWECTSSLRIIIINNNNNNNNKKQSLMCVRHTKRK